MTLTLCMIVKDEAPVIERCLSSALEVGIDSWCILDTGSIDGTPELIKGMLSHLDGELHHGEFVDFATSRTRVLELAQPYAGWLLLLDADQTVQGGVGALDPQVDAYQLRQSESGASWFKPLLLNNNRGWRFVGRTHECLDASWATVEYKHDLELVHHADGSSRSEKIERDERLLRLDLEDDPGNARSLYYLGQNMLLQHRRGEALELFDQRAAAGGWEPERWHAQYVAALIVVDDDFEDGARRLLEAFEANPTRTEPLWHLAHRHLEREQWHLARLYLEAAPTTPPDPDELFVEAWMYEWGIAVDRSLAAWRTGAVDQARIMFTNLANDPRVPEAERQAAERNLAFCPEGDGDGS